MKTFKYTALLLIAGFAMSCSSDDSEGATTAPQTFLITNQTEVHNPTSNVIADNEFTYDANNRVISQLTDSETITYSWNNDGQIYKMSATNGAYVRETVYTYDNEGKLTESQRRNLANNVLEDRRVFTYMSDRYEERYYDIDGSNVWTYKYYYSADKKNIAVMKRHFGGGGDLYDSQEYSYDDRQSVESVAPYSVLPGTFKNANNVVVRIVRDSNNAIVLTDEMSYTFNEKGFPITRTFGEYTRNYEYVAK